MHRKRVQDGWIKSAEPHLETFRGGPPVVSAGKTYFGGQNVFGSWSQIDDVVTPNFRKRIKEGELIMNPMSLRRFTRTKCPISFKNGPYPNWFNGGYELYEGDVAHLIGGDGAPELDSAITAEQLRELALVKAYAKMNEISVMGVEIYKTMDDTLRTINRPFKSAQELVLKLHARKQSILKCTRNVAKAISDSWLEQRYAWKPLISDCIEIARQVEFVRTRIKSERLVARSGLTHQISGEYPVSASVYALLGVGTRSLLRKIRVSSGVVYEAKPQTYLSRLTETSGGNLSQFPAQLWETMPWSFVCDWFVNVGEFIQAVTPNPRVTVLGNWTTVVDETTAVFHSGKLTTSWDGLTFNGTYPSFTSSNTLVERHVNQPLPTLPSVKLKWLNVQRTADTLALSVNAILGSLQRFKYGGRS